MKTLPAGALRRRTRCRLCDGDDLVNVISLAPTPPANAFVSATELDRTEPHFPLDVWLCKGCTHVQLLDVVDPAVLFGDYVYVTGTSSSFVAHFERYAALVANRFGLKPADLVVEIGSNDGTFLRFFQATGQRTLGIDPARLIASRATETGIETVCEFFTPALAQNLAESRGLARVVAANNVFAHIDDLSSVVIGIERLLAPDGLFVFEVSYLADVVEKLLFDTIYHEHLDYHSVTSLVPFFERHGLELFDVERVAVHGGSLRGFVQRRGGPHDVTSRVKELCALEQRLALDRESTFVDLAARVGQLGHELRLMLQGLREHGKKIAGFGAPAKATTLMHHFGVGSHMLDFIVDDNPRKQGLYTPGLHVPVVPAAKIAECKPDYLLVLAWNFADVIIQTHKPFVDAGGRFIVPLPNLEIIPS